MDNHNKKERSYNMSKIKSKNSKPELLIRKFLYANGLRYRLFDKKLPGKPDIVLKKYKTVIFVNGCFRHCHKNCKYSALPKSNLAYRKPKFKKNMENDKKNIKMLQQKGRKVIVVRQCQLKNRKKSKTLNALLKNIRIF